MAERENCGLELSFYDKLAQESTPYALLRAEKNAQEESAALQAAAEARKQYFARNEQKSGSKVVTPSYWTYKNHYAEHLPQAAPEVFRKNRTKRFCDIGSAPGGMSAYLCHYLRWTGLAMSLAETEGGFKMTFKQKRKILRFHACDVSGMDAWKTMLSAMDGERFDFVNLGVTLQWQPPLQNGSGPIRDNRLEMQKVLRNELLCALQCVRDGGTVMMTVPTSDHPNTFLYLSYLKECSRKPLRIMPTPKLCRSPIYVVVTGIETESEGTLNFVQYLQDTPATPENDSKWLLQPWEKARETFLSCQGELENIWTKQRIALKDQRKQAERDNGC